MTKKSHLLIDDNEQLILQTSLAVLIGDRPAIALQQVHYWADRNEKTNKRSHNRDGRWWAYNTWREWRQNNFPFWTVSTIRRIFKTLEDNGLITTEQHEDRNSGLWVTVNYDRLNALLEHKIESPREQQRSSRAKGRSAQNEQTHKLKKNKHTSVQNEQTGLSKLSRQSVQIEQPTGNTETTETTTETNYISDTEPTPSTDTPITNPISDGKDAVATRPAEHTQVTAAASDTDHTPLREAVEKQAQTEETHAAAPAEPSPACTPTREQRDAMFEAVCGHIFGVVGKDNIREMARSEHSRAGKIVSWLLKQSDGFAPNGSKKAARVVVGWISAPAHPEHVEKFAAQYKQKHRDASLPLDIVKFTDAWRAWGSELARESRRKAARAQQAEARQVARPAATPAERAAMKAQLQATRNSLKAERTDA